MRREGRDARSRPAQARLQGCTPAWMQVVEPRREQAAEVVEPRLEQAAEESSGLFNTFPRSETDNRRDN